MYVRALNACFVDIGNPCHGLEDRVASALCDLENADPWRAPGADVRVGCQGHGPAERRESVAAIRRNSQKIGRRIVRHLAFERDGIHDLVDGSVYRPDEVTAPVGNPEVLSVLGERGTVRVGALRWVAEN